MEATCDSAAQPKPQEVIELAAVLLDGAKHQVRHSLVERYVLEHKKRLLASSNPSLEL